MSPVLAQGSQDGQVSCVGHPFVRIDEKVEVECVDALVATKVVQRSIDDVVKQGQGNGRLWNQLTEQAG